MLKNKEVISRKKIIEIVVVMGVLGLAILIYDFVNTDLNFKGILHRNDAGEGSYSEDMTVDFLDESQNISVEVSEKKLDDKEIEEAFSRSIEEIDSTYLDKNESAENVCYDLNLKSAYADGMIEATWKSNPMGLIGSDGKLKAENIPEDGEVVGLTAFLYYENEERMHSFSVVVNQKSLDTLDGQLEAIKRKVQSTDEATREQDNLTLPKKVGDMTLHWKRKMNFRGLQFILLGIAAAVAIAYGQKQDAKKAAAEVIKEKERDYPVIVSQLSILMGAGMSFRKALERINGKYILSVKSKGISRAGFNDMLITYRKMSDGQSELQAIEELGKMSDCKEYRKLSMLLAQNIRKGSKDLLDALEKEEKYAFEMRKQRAVREGEEASTKLLIPMAGMLFIVIVVLIVPAMMQMQ